MPLGYGTIDSYQTGIVGAFSLKQPVLATDRFRAKAELVSMNSEQTEGVSVAFDRE